jgi:glycine/D-amino acid oxidase-like deaminating enzyme
MGRGEPGVPVNGVRDAFDLIVVGAGAIGTWTALRALEGHPEWHILLLDRTSAAAGATMHSLGVRLPFGRTPDQRRLASASGEAYARLAAKMPASERRLDLRVALRTDEMETFRERAIPPPEGLRLSEAGPPAPWLRLPEGVRLYGGLTAAHSVPWEVTRRLAEIVDADERGSLWEGVEVTELGDAADQVRVELADGRQLAATRLVLATGPWLAAHLGNRIARASGIRVKKIVALHIAADAGDDDPLIFFFGDDAFLLPVPARRQWLFSFTSRVWDVDPGRRALIVEAEDRSAGLELLARYAPALAERCVGGRAFCDSYAPDWSPRVVRDDASPRIVAITGCSGSGWRLAPALAGDALDYFRRAGL